MQHYPDSNKQQELFKVKEDRCRIMSNLHRKIKGNSKRVCLGVH